MFVFLSLRSEHMLNGGNGAVIGTREFEIARLGVMVRDRLIELVTSSGVVLNFCSEERLPFLPFLPLRSRLPLIWLEGLGSAVSGWVGG